MNPKRTWRLLVISPLVAVLGFYLFLIGANYYYAKRAAYLLERIRALKIDNSSVEELRRLGSAHGFRYDGYGDTQTDHCVNIACLDMVSPNNQWMWFFLKSPTLAKLEKRAGLRPWLAAGDIEIKNGQVVGKIYGLQFYEDDLVQRSKPQPGTSRNLISTLVRTTPLNGTPDMGSAMLATYVLSESWSTIRHPQKIVNVPFNSI
jgi:hypothetical protein